MTARTQRWHAPMSGRDPAEGHRAATPLELLFDLCFVVAVAQASIALHHEVVDGHVLDGVLYYLMVFFAIWWAWINFTWFASAYDTDDVLYPAPDIRGRGLGLSREPGAGGRRRLSVRCAGCCQREKGATTSVGLMRPVH